MTQAKSVRQTRVNLMRGNQLAVTRVTQIQMDQAKQLQRLNLLEDTNTNGDELVGLSVQLIEDPSGISVAPLAQRGWCG